MSRFSWEVIVSRGLEDLRTEKCVGVKRGTAWRMWPRVAGFLLGVFGVVMYVRVRWTMEFLYAGAACPVRGEVRVVAHNAQQGERTMH